MAQQTPYASKKSPPPIFLPNILDSHYFQKTLPFLIDLDYMCVNDYYMCEQWMVIT